MVPLDELAACSADKGVLTRLYLMPEHAEGASPASGRLFGFVVLSVPFRRFRQGPRHGIAAAGRDSLSPIQDAAHLPFPAKCRRRRASR